MRPAPSALRAHSLDDAAERRLLERVAARDAAALEQLYFAYHRRLCRFLSRTCRDPGVLEEIVNDTFLAVWQQAASFRGDGRVSTWIFGIAYRVGCKALRQLPHLWRDTLDEEALEQLPTPDADGPEQGLVNAEWVAAAMATLPTEQRLAVELVHLLGLSCAEAATLTGSPANTIKTRLFHARQRLRQTLRRSAGETPENTHAS